jgi:hypothetical protein
VGVRVRARRFSTASPGRSRSTLVLSRAAQDARDGATDDCESADPLDDVTSALDDTLGPGLGDVLDDVLPDDSGCDMASPDDPAAAGDDGTDPGADDGGDVPGDPGADDPSSE